MIRNFKKEDTTKIMTIWTKGNFQAHNFIEKDYWLMNFNKVKDEYLEKAKTYVYTELNDIKGFISVLDNGYVGALFVKEDCKRQGIGRKLINHCKDMYDKLTLKVYDQNIDAILFYMALDFRNIKVQIDEKTGEKEYVMEWNKEKKLK